MHVASTLFNLENKTVAVKQKLVYSYFVDRKLSIVEVNICLS